MTFDEFAKKLEKGRCDATDYAADAKNEDHRQFDDGFDDPSRVWRDLVEFFLRERTYYLDQLPQRSHPLVRLLGRRIFSEQS